MSKLTILAAAGVGYVLGARAGHERYEQLQQAYAKVRNDPRVQEKVQQATDVAKEKGPEIAEAAKTKASETAGAAKEKASQAGSGADSSSPASESEADGELNPDRLKAGEDTGPQGKLP